MGVEKPISEETKDKIVDRYTRGQSIKFIGFAVSVDSGRVRAVLAERGTPIRPGPGVLRDNITKEVKAGAAAKRARNR